MKPKITILKNSTDLFNVDILKNIQKKLQDDDLVSFRKKNIIDDDYIFDRTSFIESNLKALGEYKENSIDDLILKISYMYRIRPFEKKNKEFFKTWLDLYLDRKIKKRINWNNIDYEIFEFILKKDTNMNILKKLIVNNLI
ncbi:hypothetical protein [Oceanivirga salmonicida]|uniref:hypothetical protein n=1 Tax=Oceanivirga salmonicida TaxID=1769291 RepID=UPI000835758A|nr:hypothetical protein [Oceanivirga salmonicida]